MIFYLLYKVINNKFMLENKYLTTGLNDEEVINSRLNHGNNNLTYKKENFFLDAIKSLSSEPMVLLLLATSFIYFLSGQVGDAIFLAVAIVLVATISLYQNSRSKNALAKLKEITQPKCKVIRNGNTIEIINEQLVIGDLIVLEEGSSINADGEIIQSNDFSVSESILTGESLAVFKDITLDDYFVFNGTTVASGMAIAKVTAIGNKTKLGAIGTSLESIEEEKTPLEVQISRFVKQMVLVGAIIFLIVWGINYYNTANVLDSLLKALTLAMSILPEEIPVAFTTFMALGAWRLMKTGIIVKQMKTVETLGSATVICTDKTGTITENKMSLVQVYDFSQKKIVQSENFTESNPKKVIEIAMWASEPIPFDPMELALHESYHNTHEEDHRPHYKMIFEYPLDGKPPMMTHIHKHSNGNRIIATKGAPEAILEVCKLSDSEKKAIEKAVFTMASKGYRVLGVANSDFNGTDFPEKQQKISFHFIGLVAFYDPPKKNIQEVFDKFYKAGVSVKIITGDNAITTKAIAAQIGFRGADKSITGDELMQLSEKELQKRVMEINIFTRMFPEAKLKIINALKNDQQIVAMTGDGVNDGPALKSAHIGVAMGKKGTEIAKQAASLILVDDDLSKMIDAIAMGRKIYTNLKKAIQYIISIHIPIILTVFIPLALGWIYPSIFTPLHIILLELIMGPTCSIIFENEPMEKNTMIQKPRFLSTTFFNAKELTTSIIQGLVITIGTLSTYQLAIYFGYSETITRSMVFTALISANIFLTLVNRSFYYSVVTTLKYKNNLVLWIIGLTIILTALLLYIAPFAVFFGFTKLPFQQLITSIGIGFLSVIWIEGIKLYKRKKSPEKFQS